MKKIAEARAVLAADCEITEQYWRDGKTCAVGALALAAGVPKGVLITAFTRNIDVKNLGAWETETPEKVAEIGAVKVLRERILKRFGLTTDDLARIQTANDGQEKHKDRVAAVLFALDQLQDENLD